MKKLVLSSVLLTSLFAFSNTNDTYATEGKLKVEIKPSIEQISLDWNDTGKSYKIFEEDKLIWNGSKSEAIISDLEPKTLYSFTIVSYDQNNTENNVSKVTTQTEALAKANTFSRSIVTNSSQSTIDEGFIDAVISTDSVSLSLRNSIADEHDGLVEIYKNDKLLTTTYDKNYTDTDVIEGETYNYKFVLRKKLPDVDIEKAKQYLNENNIEITPEIEEEVYYEPYEYIKIVTVPKFEISLFWQPPAAPGSNQLGFMYRTFIPDAKAPAGSLVEGWTKGYEFGGDNRGFCFNCGTARTTAEAVVSFTSTSSSLATRKNIAASTLYDANGKFLKTSPGKGTIDITKGTNSKSQLYFRIVHDAEVGFSDFGFLVPSINYTVGIVAYSDGTFSASGTRDQAPSHEFYVYWPYSEGVFPIFQASNKGFEYLSPVFPNATISVSKQ